MLFASCTAAIAQIEVVDGPLKEKRIQALNYIKKAAKYGVGTKPYLAAFQRLEEEVKTGIDEKRLKVRIDSLTSSVYKQMLRARDIKQRAMMGGSGGISQAELKKYKGKRVPVSMLERLMFTYLNKERKNKGLDTLSYNSRLAGLAREHSTDMAKNKYFRHQNAEGKDAFARARDKGLNISIYENIAKVATGRGTPVAKAKLAHKSLMRSVSHRENILMPAAKTGGIGISYGNGGTIYVTQLFSKDNP